jgi:3'(2'),5'-bisphosphate nucleotidase
MVNDALAKGATMQDARPEDEALAEFLARLALDAGAAIMRVFESDAHMRLKRDSSPVCDADLFGEEVILNGLSRHSALPIVAEERCAAGKTPALDGGDFFLVDALDGTKEFLQRRDSFTVNIALIRAGAPAAGVVYAPARSRIFLAGQMARSCAAAPGAPLPPAGEWRELRARPMPRTGAVAVASRSHRDADSEAFLAKLPIGEVISTGSSLKFCLLAAGEADVYPRFGPTMEWDIAAGDAVLRRAGGLVADPAGVPMRYGKVAQAFANGPFIGWGDPDAAAFYTSQFHTSQVAAEGGAAR